MITKVMIAAMKVMIAAMVDELFSSLDNAVNNIEEKLLEALDKEIPKATTFKLGDFIKVNYTFKTRPDLIGQCGKIVDICSSEPKLGIEFPCYTHGHNCKGKGAPGHCYYLFTENVTIVE